MYVIYKLNHNYKNNNVILLAVIIQNFGRPRGQKIHQRHNIFNKDETILT